MSDVGFFVLITGLALVSLLLTFVLFKFLDATAEGKGKLLGGTIRYGGSLAGFVLLFSVLFGAFHQLRKDPGITTPIVLDGEWKAELRTTSKGTLPGMVTIRQRRGDPLFFMGGEIGAAKPMTFDSIAGMIRDRDIYLIYENLSGERGIIRGKVTTDEPKKLSLVYTDLVGYDLNADPTGYLVLTKVK